jgi:hypothetical protein
MTIPAALMIAAGQAMISALRFSASLTSRMPGTSSTTCTSTPTTNSAATYLIVLQTPAMGVPPALGYFRVSARNTFDTTHHLPPTFSRFR